MADNNSRERENSTETLIAVFSEKIEQLINAVNDIKNNLLDTKDDVRDMQLKMRDMENITVQQQKEIDESKAAAKELRGRFTGLAFTVAGSVIAGIIMVVVNMLV